MKALMQEIQRYCRFYKENWHKVSARSFEAECETLLGQGKDLTEVCMTIAGYFTTVLTMEQEQKKADQRVQKAINFFANDSTLKRMVQEGGITAKRF